MVSFGTGISPVFLPILVNNFNVKIINNADELGLEYSNTTKFLKEVERLWVKHNKEHTLKILNLQRNI